jgi:WD40 repeat protein
MVGDSNESCIVDADSNHKIMHLRGHQDYGFACAWSPNGNTIATGNQDGTCRIYDSRNTSTSLHTISTPQLAAIRCMTFDSSGRFLAFSEPVDYVTVLDTRSDFREGQIIEMWGDIVGLGFSKGVYNDGQYLTIGNCDRFVGGIVQYEQKEYDKIFADDFFA